MRSSTANGIALVEVVAGLTLMGTLLTVILISGSQHLRQLKAAERKRESVRALDDFLASWSISNFSRDGISTAVQRSGMPAIGEYGSHSLESSSRHLYQVNLSVVGKADFPDSSIVRLEVSSVQPTLGHNKTTWAEVIVPDEF